MRAHAEDYLGNSILLRANSKFLGGIQRFCERTQGITGKHNTFCKMTQSFVSQRKVYQGNTILLQENVNILSEVL